MVAALNPRWQELGMSYGVFLEKDWDIGTPAEKLGFRMVHMVNNLENIR